jgi:AraC family transcriptional regulator
MPQSRLPSGFLGWHRHAKTTLSLPTRGHYSECVMRGKFNVAKGLAVVTSAFVVHSDQIDDHGASIRNFDLGYSDHSPGLYELPYHVCKKSWPRHRDEVTQILPDLIPVPIGTHEDWLCYALDALLIHADATQASRSVGLTREHFHRRFQAAVGMTPGQVVRENKILSAIHLLRTSASLSAIANESGFADQSHMCRTLKIATGMTPMEFRWRHITPVQDRD